VGKSILKIVSSIAVYLALLFLGAPFEYASIISILLLIVLFFNPFDFHQKGGGINEEFIDRAKKNRDKIKDLNEAHSIEKRRFAQEMKKKDTKKK